MIRFLQKHPILRHHASGICLLLLIVLLAGCASRGVYHVVKPGQTLYRIAKTYDREEADLAAINGITDPTRLLVGQRIYIPGANKVRKVQPTDPPKAPPAPKVPPPPRQAAKPSVKSAAKPSKPGKPDVKPLDQGTVPGPPPAPGTFLWPVRGAVVANFGAAAGKANKGLEIAVPHGTPVTASAAGKVIYSNSGIRGYGNLVIIEHADNFFTVYGFNAKNLVKVGGFVGQGDKIALSGTPPDGKSPRLHFEIRRGKTAVNPIFFLP